MLLSNYESPSCANIKEYNTTVLLVNHFLSENKAKYDTQIRKTNACTSLKILFQFLLKMSLILFLCICNWTYLSFARLHNYQILSFVTVKLLAMFKIPDVVLDSFCIAATAISLGFYSATLEPHLRKVWMPLCARFRHLFSTHAQNLF